MVSETAIRNLLEKRYKGEISQNDIYTVSMGRTSGVGFHKGRKKRKQIAHQIGRGLELTSIGQKVAQAKSIIKEEEHKKKVLRGGRSVPSVKCKGKGGATVKCSTKKRKSSKTSQPVKVPKVARYLSTFKIKGK